MPNNKDPARPIYGSIVPYPPPPLPLGPKGPYEVRALGSGSFDSFFWGSGFRV